jgi:Ca2+-binding EF-hand superfamily protein
LRAIHFLLLPLVLTAAACGDSRKDVPPWMRPAEKPRDENFQGGPLAMLRHYDKGGDGVLDRKELVGGLRAEFETADTHHSGCLTDEQAAVINQQRQQTDLSTATPLIDWNRDGCIDFREFSAAPLSLFDQLDRNGDGRLTKEEMGQRSRSDGASDNGQLSHTPADDGPGRPEPDRRGGEPMSGPPPAVPN